MADPWTDWAQRRYAAIAADKAWTPALRADQTRAHPLARDPTMRAAPTPRSADWATAHMGPGLYRDTPARQRAREAPTLPELAQSAYGALRPATPLGMLSPDLDTEHGVYDLIAHHALPALASLPAKLSSGASYLQSTPLTTMASDFASGAGSLGRRAARSYAKDPLGTIADFTPFVGDAKMTAENIYHAAKLRHEGLPEEAAQAESYVLPQLAMGAVPEVGALAMKGTRNLINKAIGRTVEDPLLHGLPSLDRVGPPAPSSQPPSFAVRQEGPFHRVEREGVDPDVVPEAAGASLPKLRAILANPQDNEPARAARKYTRQALGTEYDVNAPAPGTSLAKQAGIGAVFREATEGSPEYKHALFERYGETMPKLVEQTGAQNYDQLTEAAYRQLAKETKDQFAAMPVRTAYHYGEGEYSTPSAMLGDIIGRGNLNVFRGGDPHPYLSGVDPDTGLTANEMFRATHDYFGHGTTGATFRPGGEEVAYGSHAQMMSPLAQLALLSETRGQNSLVNYSPLNADLSLRMAQARAELGEINQADRMGGNFGAATRADRRRELSQRLRDLGGETNYAPQQPVLLPPEYLDPYTKGGVPDWMRPLIQPRAASPSERAVHLSSVPGLTQTDPAFYGTGHRGDDWMTRSSRGDLANHTSFYLGAPGTVRPEKMVADISPHAYETQLSGLYDIADDPEGFVKLSQAANLERMRRGVPDAHIGDLTRLVSDYGYSGYRNPDFIGQGAANVLGPVGGLRPIERGASGYAAGGMVEGQR